MSPLSALTDLRPLRASKPFRRFWIGSSLSVLGSQFATFAVSYQVWVITRDPIWVGVVGLASAVPLIAFSLIGGSVADAVDRRRLVLVTTAVQLVVALGLAGQALAGLDSVPLILALVAVSATAIALGAPARRTFTARLLPAELVPAGLALTHLSFQAAMLLGPLAAGLVTAQLSLSATYALDALSFAAGFLGVASLPALPSAPGADRPGRSAIAAGLRFVRRSPEVSGALLSDLAATVLAMPVALFPVLNQERFGGGPTTLGLFLTAVAAGGIGASVLSGRVTRSPRPGRVMLVAAFGWGLTLAGVGLAANLVTVLALLAVAGACDTVSVVSRGSLVQLATPDRYLGRVASMEHLVGMAGPELGNARGGVVAALTSPALSLVSGGLLAALAVAAVAWRRPEVSAFRVASDNR